MDGRPRGSLSERVTERLRRAILDGELELGDALSEDKLASILGVSRSPVRDAFTALQQQGLIDIRPQRGSFVFYPTNEDTQNLCEFRRTVELEALRLAMTRRRDETIAAMKAAAENMRVAIAAGNALASAAADTEFHGIIIENCGNPYLISAYRLVSGKVAALRSHRSTYPTRDIANAEHLSIIALIEDGQLDAALEALGTHIIKMAERYRLEPENARQDKKSARASRNNSLDHIGPLPD